MSQTMKRDAREAMPATEPRDAEQAGVVEALQEAERFLAYYAGETGNVFVGPGMPKDALALVRSALAASPPPQPTPEAREAGDGALERLQQLAIRYAKDAAHMRRDGERAGGAASQSYGEVGAELAQVAADLRIAITRARAADAAEAALQVATDGIGRICGEKNDGGESMWTGTKWAPFRDFARQLRDRLALLTGSKQ